MIRDLKRALKLLPYQYGIKGLTIVSAGVSLCGIMMLALALTMEKENGVTSWTFTSATILWMSFATAAHPSAMTHLDYAGLMASSPVRRRISVNSAALLLSIILVSGWLLFIAVLSLTGGISAIPGLYLITLAVMYVICTFFIMLFYSFSNKMHPAASALSFLLAFAPYIYVTEANIRNRSQAFLHTPFFDRYGVLLTCAVILAGCVFFMTAGRAIFTRMYYRSLPQKALDKIV